MTGDPPRRDRSADESEDGLAVSGCDTRLSVPVAAVTIGLGSLVTWAVIGTALNLLFG